MLPVNEANVADLRAAAEALRAAAKSLLCSARALEQIISGPRQTEWALSGVSIDELELSIRSSNCLRSAGILTVGDLTQQTEADLLSLRHFGRRSLKEVKMALAHLNLRLSKGQPIT